MKTTTNQGAAPRDIPTPPGGGSWTFDDAKWEWVSNDPTPAVEEPPAADVTTTTQQEP